MNARGDLLSHQEAPILVRWLNGKHSNSRSSAVANIRATPGEISRVGEHAQSVSHQLEEIYIIFFFFFFLIPLYQTNVSRTDYMENWSSLTLRQIQVFAGCCSIFKVCIRQHGDTCSVQTRVAQCFPLSNPVQSFCLRANFCRMLLYNVVVHSIILAQRRKLPHQT